jgi:hypothetical protein
MSNNGSALQSCSPSTFIGNGDPSTQVAFNYDSDGNPAWTLVDGVQTLFTRDSDERIASQTFQAYPGGSPVYGNLTYQYDADGHMVSKGGSFAAVSIPPSETATYSKTDQLATWNGVSTTTDNASNLTFDPSINWGFTWSARNQLIAGSLGGLTETYDGLGRRESSAEGNQYGSDTFTFLHDGAGVLGWWELNGSLINGISTSMFLRTPGGGALADTSTSRVGTTWVTTTWVPLIDAEGSTIALVNAAQTGSPPTTTYTYDPYGKPTMSGAGSNFPFLYQGMEHEPLDPQTLYYGGAGNFYNPLLQRSLSEIGEQGLSGPGSGTRGSSVDPALGGGGPDVAANFAEGGGVGAGAGLATAVVALWFSDPETGGIITPVAIAATLADAIFQIFSDLFGGSDNPPIPRQLRHGRHPLYAGIIGIRTGLIVTEFSEGPKFCSDPHPCKDPPLQKAEFRQPQQPENRNAPPPPKQSSGSRFLNCLANAAATPLITMPIACAFSAAACVQAEAPGLNVLSCKVALGTCTVTAATVAACAAGVPGPEF